MQRLVARPSSRVHGTLCVPGDKSISHRAVMFSAIATGRSSISGFLPGEDCLATLAAVRAMGVDATLTGDTSLVIEGRGLRGFRPPPAMLDMGNSGTAMRLFTGMLAGQAFDSTLGGDASLSKRPMERVAEPLRRMGAVIETRHGRPPVTIRGGHPLRGIDYDMPVASAQVKSAILLAGLYAEGRTVVREPAVTRDHTERMLRSLGYPVDSRGDAIALTGGGVLTGQSISVPGDLSSAAFLILAACLARSGELVIEHVGLNPTRTGVLDILRLMGADITITARHDVGEEPCGTLRVRPSALQGADIPPALVPLAIDEFPVVFVAAALASGETRVSGAGELRHKESDRIGTMVAGLRALGVEAEELPDGALIRGGTLGGGTVDSQGDHRVAMSFAVAGARASGPVEILDTANVATSYPGFVAQARAIGLAVGAP